MSKSSKSQDDKIGTHSSIHSSSKKKKSRPSNKQANPNKKNAAQNTIRRYDAMWEAFKEKQNANHVALKTGVAWETAKRAIDLGWPRYALRPLRDRYEDIRRGEERTTHISLKQEIRDTLRMTRDINQVLDDILGKIKLREFAENFEEELKGLGPEKTITMLDRLATVLERTVKLEALLQGQSTGHTTVHHEVELIPRIAKVQSMSDAELDRIILEAKPPTPRVPRSKLLPFVEELLSQYEPEHLLLGPGEKVPENRACNSAESLISESADRHGE